MIITAIFLVTIRNPRDEGLKKKLLKISPRFKVALYINYLRAIFFIRFNLALLSHFFFKVSCDNLSKNCRE